MSDPMPDNSNLSGEADLCAQKADGAQQQELPPPPTRLTSAGLHRAMEAVGNLTRDAELQQLQTKLALLESDVGHLKDALETKNDSIKYMRENLDGKDAVIRGLTEQKDYIMKKSEREIEQLRTENEELKSAVAEAAKEAGRRASAAASVAATTEPRVKGPGQGRQENLPKAPKVKVSPVEYTQVEYFVKKGLHNPDDLRDHITELFILEKNLYWDLDKSNAKAQSKYKADWIWDLLSYRTPKYGRGKLAAMIEYLNGQEDLGEHGEQWECREAQIASWFYPDDDGSTDYVTNQMSKAMTAIETARKLYFEYYAVGKEWPKGFDKKTMEIPPSPEERKAERKRKAAARELKKAEKVQARKSAKKQKRSDGSDEDGAMDMFGDDQDNQSDGDDD